MLTHLNDLEVFIDGRNYYYELELNAANTLYELFLYEKTLTKGVANSTFLNLMCYSKSGDYDRSGTSFWRVTHAPDIRWAFTNFDMPGIKTAVDIDGTLNDNIYVHNG